MLRVGAGGQTVSDRLIHAWTTRVHTSSRHTGQNFVLKGLV
jgi:hypothetical protein